MRARGPASGFSSSRGSTWTRRAFTGFAPRACELARATRLGPDEVRESKRARDASKSASRLSPAASPGTLNVHDFSTRTSWPPMTHGRVARGGAARRARRAGGAQFARAEAGELLGGWSWWRAQHRGAFAARDAAIDLGREERRRCATGKDERPQKRHVQHATAAHVFLGAAALGVVSMHLDYKREPTREKEVRALVDKCRRWHAARAARGSGRWRRRFGWAIYNALTARITPTASGRRWRRRARAARGRRRSAPDGRPPSRRPAMVDARQCGGQGRRRQGPRSTCRYDTRIDYRFLTRRRPSSGRSLRASTSSRCRTRATTTWW